MERGRPWQELGEWCAQAVVNNVHEGGTAMREIGYRILGSVPALMLDQDMGAVLGVLDAGLKDAESLEVRTWTPYLAMSLSKYVVLFTERPF